MKSIILCALFLTSSFSCFARLVPYIDSLEEADAIAVVTVTSYAQNLHAGLIHETAVLTVDTAVRGTKVGEKIDVSFGVPSAPTNSAFLSDSLLFKIAEKYIVLIVKQNGRLVVVRSSAIIDDLVCDGYFEDFAGFNDVTVARAIDLLKKHKQNKPLNPERRSHAKP